MFNGLSAGRSPSKAPGFSPISPMTKSTSIWRDSKSLEKFADALNRKEVPPAHGTNEWTAEMVRMAYVS